ncbi:MAG TPA: YfiR family protein [Vicinamibacterales bacterium]|nr:YfiR family protein [Vicinamibacterales bacterium]
MKWRWMGSAILAGLVSLSPASLAAQTMTVPAIKAGFLANFVKFADWPADAVATGRPFTFCVVGDKAIAEALEQIVKQHPTPAPQSVTFVTADAPLRTCQLLYVGGLNSRQSKRVIESLNGAAVFTVSDADGFAELGGVAQLRIVNGRMQFAINPAAAQRARLALSAKFLGLATIVKDGPDVSR